MEAPAGMMELEAAVDQAVAACDGDLRAAVRALVIVLDATEAELEALRGEVERIEAAVSGGGGMSAAPYGAGSPASRDAGLGPSADR